MYANPAWSHTLSYFYNDNYTRSALHRNCLQNEHVALHNEIIGPVSKLDNEMPDIRAHKKEKKEIKTKKEIRK
jgi:hypothetical protein